MKPWLMAIIGRQRQLVTETFTTNAVWVAPLTTNRLETLSGKGAAGTPASSGSYLAMIKRRYTRIYYTDGSSEALNYPGTTVSSPATTAGAPIPAPYCDPKTDAPVPYAPGTKVSYCYHYAKETKSYSDPATTGASATGFGSTFPGGFGGPASTTTIANPPAVLPGASYTLVIPAGGSITFSYYK